MAFSPLFLLPQIPHNLGLNVANAFVTKLQIPLKKNEKTAVRKSL